MTSSFLSPSSLVPIFLFIILILLPYSRPLLLQDTLLHIPPSPPPSCFLFHNGGRCRRLLPNVQSITHVPVLVILIVSNTNVQSITHRCNQAALFYLVSQSLYFWIVTQQYYKFFQCSKWPKKLNVSTIHASIVQMYFCKSTPGRPRCIFCICSDLATVSPSQTILSLQCACKATCIILVFLNCKATPAYGTLLYLVICLSSTAVGGWWWWGRGGGAWDHTNAPASGPWVADTGEVLSKPTFRRCFLEAKEYHSKPSK